MVGEPQNLLIATKLGWSFSGFFLNCSVISIPVAVAGLIACPLLEAVKFPGFGYALPDRAYEAIVKDYEERFAKMSRQAGYLYITQALVAVLLILALAFHLAQIGLIGISLIIILSAFKGQTKEHDFAEAFNNAMPFVCLIVVFFAVLAVVHDQNLITPLIHWVFLFSGKAQLMALYFVNGTLSLISDNVFIASIFINEIEQAHNQGVFSKQWYDKLAVIVNMGTNVPAVATPNGRPLFCFF